MKNSLDFKATLSMNAVLKTEKLLLSPSPPLPRFLNPYLPPTSFEKKKTVIFPLTGRRSL